MNYCKLEIINIFIHFTIFLTKLFKSDLTLKSSVRGFQVHEFPNTIECIAVSV